jgi:hypothetical protein
MASFQNNGSDLVGCDGLGRLRRRQALKIASVAAGGYWMTRLAEQLSIAAEVSKTERPKSLLVLWCQGGPSQLETFDPHPGTMIGGEVSAIPTSATGVEIAGTMPAVAEQMHRVCLVRSMISREGDHERATYYLKTGWRPDPTVIHPAIGSVLCYASPSNLEIPRHISILSSQWPARGGYLGPAWDAFKSEDPRDPIPNLTSYAPLERVDRRHALLEMLENNFQKGRIAGLDQNRTLHRTATERAVQMMSSEQLAAFDIGVESESVRLAFGDTPFGRGCLAGVRLLETGVRCVEVELGGWDTHINNHQLQSASAATLDLALAATLKELEERDLLKDTVVMCGGEFGRTPQINPAAGRDHWPHGFSMLLAGGGFRGGYVHGSTNSNPSSDLLESAGGNNMDLSQLVSDTVTVEALHATVLNALGINPSEQQMTPIGRPLEWSEGKPVAELLDA